MGGRWLRKGYFTVLGFRQVGLEYGRIKEMAVDARWYGTVLGFRLDNAELDFVDGRSLFVS